MKKVNFQVLGLKHGTEPDSRSMGQTYESAKSPVLYSQVSSFNKNITQSRNESVKMLIY